MELLRSLGRRRVVALATAALLVASGYVWAAEPSLGAGCTVLANFEIDGDMTAGTAGCAAGAADWNTINPQSTSQGGTYSSASKDPNDPSGWVSSGSTPPKSDFNTVYAKTAVVGGDFVAYVGWERDSGTGTGSYAIEVDNAPTRVVSTGTGNFPTPQPDRSAGGFIIYLDFQGAALPTFREACSFTSVADYPGTCTTTPGTAFAEALNTSDMTDPFTNVVWPAGQFFEAAIDFTALTGIKPDCPAPAAASLYLRSITGNTLTNLKGYVAPFEVAPPSTCVPPNIVTTATPGDGALGNDTGVVPGAMQRDDVSVGPPGPAATGTVQFVLCSPDVVAANNGDCSKNGDDIGLPVELVSGLAHSDEISGSTDTTPGKYCWRAEYTPGPDEHTYSAFAHTNSTTECFTVLHGSPKLATTHSDGGDFPGALGLSEMGDTATLTDFVGDVSGETVHFTLYGPYADGVTPDCVSPVAFTTTGTLNASGVATTSATFEPTLAGHYVWRASVDSTALNDAATDACNSDGEAETIVGAVVDVAKSANPPGPVSAGDPIGFDITVTNEGSIPALGTTVTDDLPAGADGVAGGDLHWTTNDGRCTISGSDGAQVLSCDLGRVDGPGSLDPIHVQSDTSDVDCGVVKNKATVTTTNGTGGDSDLATVSVLCANVSLEKTPDADVVNAGEPIGFTITARNADAQGTGVAHGAVINDPLPSGPTGSGIDWTIADGPANCSIVGAPPSQALQCTAVDLAAGASESVHVTSATVFASCGTYDNTASLTVTNGPVEAPITTARSADLVAVPVLFTAFATTSVQCPALAVTKTADADHVNSGGRIGFTITGSNAGPGTALNAVIQDDLPAHPGVHWTIDSTTAAEGACAVTGPDGSQVLTCELGSFPADASVTVHVGSDTTAQSCGDYDNTAQFMAANSPTASASATTTVDCAEVLPETPPLATTGAGPVNGELGWAFAMIMAGFALVLLGRRRRLRRAH